MRTTLTLNDSLVNELKTITQETGKPFKQVVNETLFIGLQYHKPAQPYCLKSTKLGQLYPGINLDKALQLASALEDKTTGTVGNLTMDAHIAEAP